MSTLHQSLARLRGDEPSPAAPVAAAALIARTWQGETWVLPWSHLVSARWTEDGRRAEIAFTACTLILTGERLPQLIEDLAAFRVGLLREVPADYRALADAPFIARLEVRPASPEARAPS